ncbi:MAG: hypothetical protein INF88_14820 [Roseomonas sp.]|nr:hypothetical protein [Roseomonas sp.]
MDIAERARASNGSLKTAAATAADVTGRLSEQVGGAGTPILIARDGGQCQGGNLIEFVRAGTSLCGEGAFKPGMIAGLALHGLGPALPVRRVLAEGRRALLDFA